MWFATGESLGDSFDDYFEIGFWRQVAQPTFTSVGAISHAAQNMVVSGTLAGDQFSWTSSGSCQQGPASLTSTVVYHSEGEESEHTLHTATTAGS